MSEQNQDEHSTEDYKLQIQAYKLELKLLYEKSQETFEKQLSYLSAGALGFSMLYIENVVKDIHRSDQKWALITSWGLLTLTLMVNLFSHYISSRNNFKSIEEIDNDAYDPGKITLRIKKMNYINVGTIISFTLGILLLTFFIIFNTMYHNVKKDPVIVPKNEVTPPKPQTGQNPTPPPAQPIRSTPNK